MSLTIELPDDIGAALKARAQEQGISLGEVVREGLHLLKAKEQEDQAKLKWLRAAAKEGFDAIECGDFVTLGSEEEIDAFLKTIHEEVSAELAAERKLG